MNYSDVSTINNSVSCLWAGDINFDGSANAADLTVFNAAFVLSPHNYNQADVTLDAILNNRDLVFIRDNTIRNIYSPVIFFIKN
jgi:polyribonucleotide nucleotidyltransferase